MLKVLRLVFTAGLIGYLGYRVYEIGLEEVWAARPRTPWFYIIFLGMYATLPFFELIIFGLVWKRPWREVLPVLFKKRVFNREVLGYSGEVYLYLWAREHIGMPNRRILHIIKDNVIISSLVSTLIAAGLLLLFAATGQLPLPAEVSRYGIPIALGALLIGGLFTLVGGRRLRKAILWLPGRLIALLFLLHFLRILGVQILQVAQWAVVMPEQPLSLLFTLLAVQIVVGRLPIPSREFLFIGAGVELSSVLGVPASLIASILLMSVFLDKALNFVLFSVLSLKERRSGRQDPAWDERPDLDLPLVAEAERREVEA